jgi:hypothetical protein
METEYGQIEIKVQSLEREIAYWKEVLQKSEKYERLMQEPDFLEVLKDLDQGIEAHDNEIEKCLDGMAEYSPKLLAEAQHTIFVHQILREQSKKARNRPKEILELAKEARKRIPELEDNLKKVKEELRNA